MYVQVVPVSLVRTVSEVLQVQSAKQVQLVLPFCKFRRPSNELSEKPGVQVNYCSRPRQDPQITQGPATGILSVPILAPLGCNGVLLFIAKWTEVFVYDLGTLLYFNMRYDAFSGAFWRRITLHQLLKWRPFLYLVYSMDFGVYWYKHFAHCGNTRPRVPGTIF